MFHFTNEQQVYERIINTYLDTQDSSLSPIDKLNLCMSITGKVIEEMNEYVKPPKKSAITIQSFPDEEEEVFIQASSSKEEVIEYLASKSNHSKVQNLQPIIYSPNIKLFNKNCSTFKHIIDTKNSNKLDKYKMSYNRLKFLMKNKLCCNLITNCVQEIFNEKNPIKIQEYYEHLAFCKVIMKLKPRYMDCDRSNLSYYRPLTELNSIVPKMIDTFICIKLKDFCIDNNIFHSSQVFYSTDAIFRSCSTVTNDIDCMNLQNPVVKLLLFMDIKEAYTNVIHEKLINILIDDEFPPYIINYIYFFLQNMKIYYKTETNSFDMNRGLIMGQSSSQVLFNIYMNAYIREIYEYIPDNTFETDNPLLLKDFMIVYVDDIIFRISSNEQLELLKFILPPINDEFGFEFNGKCRKHSLTITDEITICGITIPDIEVGFAYLGGYIHPDKLALYKWINENLIISKCKSLESGNIDNQKLNLYYIIKKIIVPFSFKIVKSSVKDVIHATKYTMIYIKYYIKKLCPNYINQVDYIIKYYENTISLHYHEKLLDYGQSQVNDLILKNITNIQDNYDLLSIDVVNIIGQVSKKKDDFYEALS